MVPVPSKRPPCGYFAAWQPLGDPEGSDNHCVVVASTTEILHFDSSPAGMECVYLQWSKLDQCMQIHLWNLAFIFLGGFRCNLNVIGPLQQL